VGFFTACGSHEANIYKFYETGQYKIDWLLDSDGKVFSIENKLIKNNLYASKLKEISEDEITLDDISYKITKQDIFTKKLDIVQSDYYEQTIIRDNPNNPEFIFTDQYNLKSVDAILNYMLIIKHNQEEDRLVNINKIEATDAEYTSIINENGHLKYNNIDINLKFYNWNTGELKDIAIDTIKHEQNNLVVKYCFI
jgi:hypothetical protein